MLNLLNEANESKFVAIKWNIVNDQTNTNCGEKNQTIYNTEILKSNFFRLQWCLHSITITQVAFKACASFTKCITKSFGATVNYAEDLDLVMPM